MSTDNVDTRVVELDFDNKQFEKSAKQSISTLDKLKKSLSFDNVSDSIDEISVSFSKMEVVAMTVIQNITNRITNLGINLVKSLTIDNITSGWVKFGQKTTSVATMAAQSLKVAGKELSDYTEKMAAVDKYLNQLNWFSDETSYTFTDMVDNIGKFTAAGQDLDASVKAMMGIANWAALSGQNATTAARAMYQLSQALSKGNVQLIDYKSIQTANMDTQEFRQTVLDTAVALGELTKSGDNYITKTGKKFTRNQFTEQLSEKWFTDKVLIQSLDKYSSAVEQIYSIAQETGLTASEVIEQYGDSLDEFGVKAFKAAQEARTFSDSLNSVKDAYSTAWMKTFEYIFGGYDDAKSLWTDLANELYDAVVESNNFRNEILEVWSALSGRADLMAHTGDDDQGAFWNIYDAIIAIKDIISQAWNDIFPLSLFSETSDQAQEIGSRLKNITSNLQSLSRKLIPSQETLEKLRKILNGVFSVVKFGLNLIKLSWAALQPIVTIAKNLISALTTFTGKLGTGLTTVLEKLSAVLEKGVQRLWEFWDVLYDNININKIVTNIGTAVEKVKGFFRDVGGTFKKYISPIFESIKTGVSTGASFIGTLFGNKLSNSVGRIQNKKSARKSLDNSTIDETSDTMDSAEQLGDKLRTLGIKIKNSLSLDSILDNLYSFVEKIINFLSETLWPIITSMAGFIKKVFGSLFKVVKSFVDGLSSFLDTLGDRIQILIDTLAISNLIYQFLDSIVTLVSSILVLARSLISLVVRTINVVASFIKLLAKRIDTIFSDSESSAKKFLDFGDSLKKLVVSIGKIISGLIKVLGSTFELIGDVLELLADMISRVVPVMRQTVEGFKQLNSGLRMGLIIMTVVVAGVAGVLLTAKIISDIIWELTGPIKNIGNSISDFLDSKSTTGKLRSATALLNSISLLLISFSVACAVFQTLDPTVLISTVAVLFAFIGGLVGLTILLGKFSDFTVTYNKIASKLSNGIKSIKTGGVQQKKNDVLSQFSRFLTSISVSLLIIAAAMSKLSSIGLGGIGKGLLALLGFFVILGGTMVGLMAATKLLNKDFVSKSDDLSKLLKSISVPLLAMSVLILSLSNSLAIISTIEYGPLWSALTVVTVFMAVVLAMFALIAKMGQQQNLLVQGSNTFASQFTGIGAALFAMSSLILSLSTSLSKISNLASSVGWTNVWIAFVMLSLLMSELSGMCAIIITVSKIIDSDNPAKSMKSISSILKSMSLLLLSVTVSLSILSSIGWTKAIAAIGEITLVMAALVTAALVSIKQVNKLDGEKDNTKALSSFFRGMSLAVLAVAAAISIVALFDWQKVLAAAGALSMIIVTFGTMSTLVSKFGKMSLLITFAASIGAATAAMSAGLMLIAKYDWEKLLAAAGALSMIIVTFGGMVTLMNLFGGLSASVLLLSFGLALVEVSAAAMLFATAIQKVADVNLSSIGKSLLIFAGGIIAFAAASLLVTPIIPIMLALGVSLTLLGVAMLVIGKSMTSITDSLVPMCETISENIQLITDTFTTMANSIGDMIANIIVNAFNNLTSMIDSVAEFVSKLFASIIAIAKENLPELWSLITDFLSKVFTYINENREEISELIVGMFTSLLSKIDEYGPTIADKLFSIVNTFMAKLRDNIPTIVTTIIDIVIAIIDALTKNVGKLVNSIKKFIIGLLKTLIKAVGQIMTTIITQMLNLVGLIIRLIGTSLGTLMGDLVIFIGYLLNVLVQAFRGMVKVIGQTFLTIFAIIVEAIHDTIKNATTAIKNAFKIIVADLYNLLLDAIDSVLGRISIVHDWVQDQRDAMDEYSKDARNWMEYMASGKNIQEAAKNAANSINEATSTFNKDIAENTKNGIDAINEAFSDFLSNQDTEVTITPVVDDSELDAISDNLDKELDYSGTTNTANATNDAVSRTTSSKTVNNETTYNNNNTYTSTFNISGNYDPNEIADIVDQRMQTNAQTGRLTRGTA